ncbi:MAG TPA: gamma-glutamyltransferase [Chloroflexota bacterium]
MPHTYGTPAYSADGVVAAPHYLASHAGIDVLRDGGSAVDAAIAANLVLAVVWPQMCGPGGDLFAQVWHGSDAGLFGLNASGRAGEGMSAAAYRARGLTGMPQRGVLSVTVPGAVDGWFSLHQRFGRLEMSRIARDAIHYARDGFRLTPFVAAAIRANAALLAQHGGGASVFVPDGRPPSAGEMLVQRDLADTLEQLARQGPRALYAGTLGERILAFVSSSGGGLTAADFAAQRSEWVEPVSVDYRGARVFELPPNSQGVVLLEMLNMLAGLDLSTLGRGSAELLHQLVERKKLAFEDRDAYVADAACVDVPLARMLDPVRAGQRADRIGQRATQTQPTSVGRSVDGDTIYLCAADRDGTVVSLIQSLYAAFGSGVHVPGTGVTLHNRGFGFTLMDGHPNELTPGKRPMHTLMPGFATRSGQAWLAFGTRGADGQPQTALQLLMGLLDAGLDLQAAVEAPRWVHGAPGERYPATALVLEGRFSQSVADELAGRGHEVMLADPVDSVMGTVQTIQVDQQQGCYIAASDPRGDGVALAL